MSTYVLFEGFRVISAAWISTIHSFYALSLLYTYLVFNALSIRIDFVSCIPLIVLKNAWKHPPMWSSCLHKIPSFVRAQLRHFIQPGAKYFISVDSGTRALSNYIWYIGHLLRFQIGPILLEYPPPSFCLIVLLKIISTKFSWTLLC